MYLSDATPPAATSAPGDTSRSLVHRGGRLPAMPIGTLPPAMLTAPSLAGLLKALQRRWLVALVLGTAFAALAAAAVWQQLPPGKYTARALLHIASNPATILYHGQANNTEITTYGRTQMALLKSRAVLTAALQNPKVLALSIFKDPNDPAKPPNIDKLIEWLDKDLQVDNQLGPEIIRVSLNGNQPEDLAALVDSIVTTYLKEIVNKDRTQRDEKLRHLTEQYEAKAKELQALRQQLKDLVDKAGSGNTAMLTSKYKLKMEKLANAEKELLQVQSELRKTESDIAIAKSGAKPEEIAPISQAAIEAFVAQDPAVLDLQAQIARLEAKIEQAAKVLARGDKDPYVNKYKRELDQVKQSLTTRRNNLKAVAAEQLRDRARGGTVDNLAFLQAQQARLKEHEKALQKDVDDLHEETKNINSNAIQVEELRSEILSTEEFAKQAQKAIVQLEVENQAPPRVTLLEAASSTAVNDGKKKMLMLGGAAVGGFGFVCLALAWLEFHARRIHTVDEVVHGLGLRLVGTVPALPGKNRLPWGRGQPGGPQSVLAESVDSTRALLLHAAKQHGLGVVMVTSAVQGEGKTTLATSLAASLARAGQRTLLVDCDLRNPCTHKRLEMPLDPGLSEVLRGEVELAQAIHLAPLEGLSLLPAGRTDAEALHALGRDGLKDVFDQLRKQFDFILVDTCPVLPVADALQAAKQADAVIFAVLRDVSRVPKVYAAYQRLATMGTRLLGAVVGGARDDTYGYGSYGYPKVAAAKG